MSNKTRCQRRFRGACCLQVADSLHHEMSSHLARCHFTIEPIAVAVHRTLADEHPLALLLNTHMRFHIANDSVAAYTLSARLVPPFRPTLACRTIVPYCYLNAVNLLGRVQQMAPFTVKECKASV
ncbi:MAG: hypothetical protein HC767_03080 [Akkermansiaceae bacterium]|nr:hypothetical protein [Akkermansiaceae bacterium]